MSDRFVRLHHWDPKCPGLRLRLSREPDECAELVEETTLPERVMNPNANRVDCRERISLTTENVRWLHEVTGELLAEMERDE